MWACNHDSSMHKLDFDSAMVLMMVIRHWAARSLAQALKKCFLDQEHWHAK